MTISIARKFLVAAHWKTTPVLIDLEAKVLCFIVLYGYNRDQDSH